MAACAVFAGLLYQFGLVRLNHPDVRAFPVRGLDVSHHQGKIDWSQVPKNDYRFVYIKATEGGDWDDNEFPANWAGAKANNLAVGAYHFFTFCRSGSDQARNFIRIVPVKGPQLPPAADLEFKGNCPARPSVADFAREYRAFADLIFKTYKVHPVIYTTDDFLASYGAALQDKHMVLWIRDVVNHPDVAWEFWQFADNGSVRGISGPVDLDVFNGGVAEFEKLLRD